MAVSRVSRTSCATAVPSTCMVSTRPLPRSEHPGGRLSTRRPGSGPDSSPCSRASAQLSRLPDDFARALPRCRGIIYADASSHPASLRERLSRGGPLLGQQLLLRQMPIIGCPGNLQSPTDLSDGVSVVLGQGL